MNHTNYFIQRNLKLTFVCLVLKTKSQFVSWERVYAQMSVSSLLGRGSDSDLESAFKSLSLGTS